MGGRMIALVSSELGHTERDGNAISPRLASYMKAAGIDWPQDQSPPYWGGALLAWVAIRQGLTPPPNPIDPDAWLSWGHPRGTPTTGAIVILTGGRQHRIGTVTRVSGDKVYVIHPVNGQVSMEAVPADAVIATRWPPNGGVAQPSQSSVQEVRITVDQQGAALPALPSQNLIEHEPATHDDQMRSLVMDLRFKLAEMQSKVETLERTLNTHSHVFVKSDGTAIPFDDIVLRSELKAG